MEAVRKVYRQLPDILKMPKDLQHRRVEVILLPLDVEQGSRTGSKVTLRPLSSYAGAWAGESLVREDQGAFEVREELI